MDVQTLSIRLLEIMQTEYPDRLRERYKISGFEGAQPWEILEMIGKKRGMLLRGGEIDYERAAAMLLDEYRGGKLGRLTLDKVGE